MALGPSLMAARGPGDAEVGRCYLRARALCAKDAPELLHILSSVSPLANAEIVEQMEWFARDVMQPIRHPETSTRSR